MKLRMLNGIKNRMKNIPFFKLLYQKLRKIVSVNRDLKTRLHGTGNTIKIGSGVNFRSCNVRIQGHDNHIEIIGPGFFNNVTFNIQGNRNMILLAPNVNFIRGGVIWIDEDNCNVEIGEFSTFEDVHIAATEPGSRIVIGKDCMFAYDIDLRTGDSHSIINMETGGRTNFGMDIEIEDHVWVASHVSILKGVRILRDSVVATRSVVTKSLNGKGVLIAGVPARVIKENISWDRKRIRKENAL